VVALRTYTDAWLFAVPDAPGSDAPGSDAPGPDAVAAALRGTPVRVPLPDEPQGEALAFTTDGTLLSGSESRGGATGQIRAVPGAAGLVAPSSSPPTPIATPAATPAPAAEAAPAWRTAAIGAAALVAVLGVLAAAMARHAARRR
jgi:hypothetical protein